MSITAFEEQTRTRRKQIEAEIAKLQKELETMRLECQHMVYNIDGVTCALCGENLAGESL